MCSDAQRQEAARLQREELRARWEAVEARELASMTEERAREIIQSLGAAKPLRRQAEWSGLTG